MSEVGLPGEIVLEIPIGQFAKKKCYGLDMGGSLLKLAYVIADDDAETGFLHLGCFPLSETEKVIHYLSDLFRGLLKPGQRILSSGFAAQRMKSHLNNVLNVSLQTGFEMDYFAYSLRYMLKYFPESEVMEQGSPDFEKEIDVLVKDIRAMGDRKKKLKTTFTCKIWGDFPDPVLPDKVEYENNKKLNGGIALPCLLVAVGSGVVMTKIDNDGIQSLAGVSIRSGRTFLGLGHLLTGAKTYDELISLAAEGDFRNVCTVAHNEQSSEVEGVYNVLPDNTILHCFSQGANKNLGDFTREDLAAGWVWTLCTDIADVIFYNCKAHNVRDVYITGSLTGQSKLVREYLERAFVIPQNFGGEIYAIRIHFMKYGSQYGALGAMLKEMESQD